MEYKFIILPRPRTGGTLLATMLNSHHQISMGYELFPKLLEDDDGNAYGISNLIAQLDKTQVKDNEGWLKSLPKGNFRTFVARARRSGIEPDNILVALKNGHNQYQDFTSFHNRILFIESLLREQAKKKGAKFFGSKLRSDPFKIFNYFPKAIYLMMLRDGRDILDSRMDVGNFETEPRAFAKEWSEDLEKFSSFLRISKALGCLVRYEELVNEPRKVLKSIMDMAELDLDERMINFTEVDQPLFRNSHGHLSAKQLQLGLQPTSIGRWRRGLSKSVVEQFEQEAHVTLRDYGYLNELYTP